MNKKFILLLAGTVLLSFGNLAVQAAPDTSQPKVAPNNAIVQPNKNFTKQKTNFTANTNKKLANKDKKFNSIQKNHKGNRIVKYNNNYSNFHPREHIIGYNCDKNKHLKQIKTVTRIHPIPNHHYYSHHYVHHYSNFHPRYSNHYNNNSIRHYWR